MLGGYGSAAQGGKVGPAAAAAAKTWALGVPLGVVIRSIGRGYVPAVSFIGVSLAVTGVLMIGWRAALAAITPEVSEQHMEWHGKRTASYLSMYSTGLGAFF